jgi:hypothetical protein
MIFDLLNSIKEKLPELFPEIKKQPDIKNPINIFELKNLLKNIQDQDEYSNKKTQFIKILENEYQNQVNEIEKQYFKKIGNSKSTEEQNNFQKEYNKKLNQLENEYENILNEL